VTSCIVWYAHADLPDHYVGEEAMVNSIFSDEECVHSGLVPTRSVTYNCRLSAVFTRLAVRRLRHSPVTFPVLTVGGS
jgi:hypothetical protein